ncbi:uncharacterized protein LOC129601315 isoform X2 [Paramacrobiotus metropolitanus]|uniref:uncharacterized protein LOC129601315 isoform X2 n=1 Tax=Paramacrobiotus metropolitanus TaxID=2943436 RepID=UPI0024458DDB|nr:uncharacterized protein LOC129601315 isoform X2 [Paramacrobiotus metropolitanus]
MTVTRKCVGFSGNRMCREEPMESTSCNPLSYFILQTANKTLTDCSFRASTPAADTLSNLERIRWGLASRKWKQCLRFQQNQMHFFYLVKYIFRPASFSYSNRKYTPVRIETTMLHPNNGKSGTRNLVVFDFVSFSSHAKDRISDSTIPATMNCSSGSSFKSVSSTSISTTTKRRTTYRKG